MTPARQALLDALIVERYTPVPKPAPNVAEGRARLMAADREVHSRVTCRGCGSRVDPDQPCGTCRRRRETKARRARLRVIGA